MVAATSDIFHKGAEGQEVPFIPNSFFKFKSIFIFTICEGPFSDLADSLVQEILSGVKLRSPDYHDTAMKTIYYAFFTL